jgi:hypothetical protein
MCKVYNEWAWETFGRYNDRLSPVACVATGDLDGAIAEIERTAALGFRAFTLPCKPNWGAHDADARNYNLPEFDRLWACVQATGKPVTFHVSTGRDPRAARGDGGAVINYVAHNSRRSSLSPIRAHGRAFRHPPHRSSGHCWYRALIAMDARPTTSTTCGRIHEAAERVLSDGAAPFQEVRPASNSPSASPSGLLHVGGALSAHPGPGRAPRGRSNARGRLSEIASEDPRLEHGSIVRVEIRATASNSSAALACRRISSPIALPFRRPPVRRCFVSAGGARDAPWASRSSLVAAASLLTTSLPAGAATALQIAVTDDAAHVTRAAVRMRNRIPCGVARGFGSR